MGSIADQLIAGRQATEAAKLKYKFDSAMAVLQNAAKDPTIHDPATVQKAYDDIDSLSKHDEKHNAAFKHSVLKHVKQLQPDYPAQPPNGGAMSSGGSAAPQAVMPPPPADPNTTTLNYGGMPPLSPPPGVASAPAPAEPATLSDTSAPTPAPGTTSPPSPGWGGGPLLRNNNPVSPPPGYRMNDALQRVQAGTPAAMALSAQQLKVYQDKYTWLTKPQSEGGAGLNGVQATDILGGHPGQYEPTSKLSEGDVLANNTNGKVIAAGAPKITTIAPGGMGQMVDPAARLAGGAGIPPPPGNGVSTIQGPPPLPSKRAIEAKSSYTAFRQSTDPTYKWSENDLPKAEAYFKESSMSPTDILMKNLQAASLREAQAMRRLSEQQLNLHIQEFKQTKGPEAIDAMADQIYANPETQKKLTGDLYNLVAQRYTQKYGLPMPRDLPANVQTQEEASKVSLNHIDAIRELLKNPVIQKRLGAFSGRVGNLEQELGTTVGLSPADAQAIQNFRTRIPYLFGQEARALFGARPPQKFMDDLKAASPNMKKGMPLFLGALDAAEAMGKLNVITAEQSRNGGKVRPEIQRQFGMAAPPGVASAPAPPKIGEVRDGHRFKGGNPGLQSNWEKVL